MTALLHHALGHYPVSLLGDAHFDVSFADWSRFPVSPREAPMSRSSERLHSLDSRNESEHGDRTTAGSAQQTPSHFAAPRQFLQFASSLPACASIETRASSND